MSVNTERDALLLDFFQYLFGHDEGIVCIAVMRPPARRDTFNERFFQWPDQRDEMLAFIDKSKPEYNVYFGVNLLSAPKRRKENCIPQNVVWSDLDACPPDQLDIPPQCVVESSLGRFQAIWKLDEKIDPLIAEVYSKRIAYHYAHLGVDKSGHDLTQLFRVPSTYNFKYGDPQEVRLRALIDNTVPTSIFETLPSESSEPTIEIPELANLPTPEMVIYRYQDVFERQGLQQTFARYYSEEPESDWSGALWRLLLLCMEVGMSAQEAFVIAMYSKCNKYERDKRPISHLWREVQKAENEHRSVELMLMEEHRHLVMPQLLTPQESEHLPETLIDEYRKWASNATDAVEDFHEITCVMLMSSLMATTLRLQTSHSNIVPNLWALIMGDSGTTRKTTAMDLAMDFIMDIDRDLILAADASPEGLLSSLSMRPKMVSIFYRDEVTGFFDHMMTREHMRSMPEVLTKLYDVPKYYPKRLKKETYVVSEPIFVFLGGGIPEKLYTLIDENDYVSGFMPRFLVIRGWGDVDRIRPVQPPQPSQLIGREAIASTFTALHQMYTNQTISMVLPTGETIATSPEINVVLTDEMWARAGQMERQLLEVASQSAESVRALPAFTRLFISMLKLTMLIAASKREPNDLVVKAEMSDLLCAAYYIQKWGRFTIDILQNAGIGKDESTLLSIYRMIERKPGIVRSAIMQRYHLYARQMQLIEDTLVQRRMVEVHQKGRGRQYWPLGH